MKALYDLFSSEELHKITDFPFKSVLSFDKLINAWEEMAESPNKYEKRFATEFVSTTQGQPALTGLIYDENTVI
ncbi:MAG: hypothetical protein ACI959_001384 [Limisphaerales bacterium]|jgi:hypothetical protein